jgi:hypothetical protein
LPVFEAADLLDACAQRAHQDAAVEVFLCRAEVVEEIDQGNAVASPHQSRKLREIAEAALAHTNEDAVEAAYRRSDALDKRRQLMDAWASYQLPAQTNVIVLPA